MIVTTTVPGPDAASCAFARVTPITPTSAMTIAIQRFISDLLFCDDMPANFALGYGAKQSGRRAIGRSEKSARPGPFKGSTTISSFWLRPVSAIKTAGKDGWRARELLDNWS